MPSSRPTGSLAAGSLSVLVLGIAWGTVLMSIEASLQPDTSAGPTVLTPSDSSSDMSLRLRSASADGPSVPSPRTSAVSSSSAPLDRSPDDAGPNAARFPFPLSSSPEDAPGKTEAVRIPAVVAIKCEAELERFCPASLSSRDRLRCMQRNAHKLPFACQNAVQARVTRAKENLRRLRLACEADARQYCRHVGPREGQLLQCLETRAQEISEGCFQALPKRPVINFESAQ
ncbi:MAG TPA: hypothetical protein VNK46_10565 [Nitrospiraceae bacterium]|jgi:hypothetical protein|nr:hypothetical protein [Nitrospiraceae bacterium]